MLSLNLPEPYKLAWLISAVIVFVIFLLLADWYRLKYTVWGGLMTAGLQLLVDSWAIKLNLYSIETTWHLFGSPVFFTFGVVLTLGILYAQTLPQLRWLQALHIVIITTLFSFEELLYVKVGVLKYLNWNQGASTFVNLLVFTSYTWIIDSLGLNRAGRKMNWRP